jgi:hypothetical protein
MHRIYTEVEPSISDWSAELVNSILGRVKSDMKKKGYDFTMGIPTVFVGNDLELFYSTKVPNIFDYVKCCGPFGECYLEANYNIQELSN